MANYLSKQGIRGCILTNGSHDDVIKWKHFPHYWPFVQGIHRSPDRSPVNFPHKGQWRGPLMFSLVCVWIKGWLNNHEAGDLRRYRAHYDVTVMLTLNVRGLSYLGLTRSISWLLMLWLLTSPGHQQPWYWLCRICRSWSYLRKDFKYLCYISVE